MSESYSFQKKSEIQLLAQYIKDKANISGNLSVEGMKSVVNDLYVDTGLIDRTIEVVTIPKWIRYIEPNAFANCSKLSHVNFDDESDLARISSYAFQYCTSLREIKLPNGVVTIHSNAFKRCTALSEITLPASISTIHEKAFQNCTGLTEVTFKGKPEMIAWDAFVGCKKLRFNMPWSYGEVEGLPWGADSASCYYNYQLL